MRPLRYFERWRVVGPEVRAVLLGFGGVGDDSSGVFDMPSLKALARWAARKPLTRGLTPVYRVIATIEGGWDHVSVSLVDRCPTWHEMEAFKRHFFRGDEVAMQLHVPPTEHVNLHAFCLHLWRPQGVEIPRPPAEMIGPSAAPSARMHDRDAWCCDCEAVRPALASTGAQAPRCRICGSVRTRWLDEPRRVDEAPCQSEAA